MCFRYVLFFIIFIIYIYSEQNIIVFIFLVLLLLIKVTYTCNNYIFINCIFILKLVFTMLYILSTYLFIYIYYLSYYVVDLKYIDNSFKKVKHLELCCFLILVSPYAVRRTGKINCKEYRYRKFKKLVDHVIMVIKQYYIITHLTNSRKLQIVTLKEM